jgi:hypothetical protein
VNTIVANATAKAIATRHNTLRAVTREIFLHLVTAFSLGLCARCRSNHAVIAPQIRLSRMHMDELQVLRYMRRIP